MMCLELPISLSPGQLIPAALALKRDLPKI